MSRKDIRDAILNKNTTDLSAAMLVTKNGPALAQRILDNEVSSEIQQWWMGELCDKPHDPFSLAREAGNVVYRALQMQTGE